ncbi:cytochrome P450 family protein [Alkalicoccobacillus plakortidis]|uniref:Cytochrome P450 n=1 Tax=Alkalicoccobacillus plakortidis TaxID=444060 RepID=A0ABT0XNZ1_9BACI|nr:cytochrome P450 [Alkalicoccobacillus plakortidis]MCM2677455.1 cytochrome P450 [Alkalicoccobacillus plakortidis]
MNHEAHVSVEERVLGFLSGQTTESPFSLFAQLREMGPVISVRNPLGESVGNSWMITKMDIATQVLKDAKSFTVDPSSIESDSGFREDILTEKNSSPDTFFTGKSMLFIDGIDHKRLRRLVSKAFTPKYMESLRPRIQELADELIDQVKDKGRMDLVKDYAYPLPINVISEMLGVPKEDRANLQIWSSAIAKGLGWGKQDPGIQKHLKEFGAYTKELVERKRITPADDLISQLIEIEEEGEQLNEDELISMITLLIFAGHETTSNLIATGTMMLFDHPEQLDQLKADLSLIPTAVEELLRFNGPTTSVGPRFAKVDLELAGQSIKKGDMLLIMVKSANRDEEKFHDSDGLDITRDIHRHLAFGFGMHMCLGAPLARVEGDIAFTTLLGRLPNLQLSIPPEEVNWQFSISSQSIESLPVSF